MIRIHFAGLSPERPPIPLARALLGLPPGDNHDERQRLAGFAEVAQGLFAAVDLAEAQVVVYPHQLLSLADTEAPATAARQAGLPCLFFRFTDDVRPIRVPCGVVYRDSLLASAMQPYERPLAAFCRDPLRGRTLTLLAKPPVPTLGFCGYVGSAPSILAYSLLGRQSKVRGLRLRRRVLGTLRRSPGIRCGFIYRTQYWGGAVRLWPRRLRMLARRALGRPVHALNPGRDLQREQRVYKEFVENLLGNAYTVCLRGAGNFSYRFYEALAAGRIPLFINTDCALPFADEIDWKKHCVWVEESQIPQAGAILRRFHDQLTPEAFAQLQAANRKLWEDYLRPDVFYARALQRTLREFAAGQAGEADCKCATTSRISS